MAKPKKSRITKEKFKLAVAGTGGILTSVAQKLGCNRQYLYVLISKHPEYKEILDQETERILDVAENTVIERVLEKDFNASKWYLEKKGQERGYGQEPANQNTDRQFHLIIEKPTETVTYIEPIAAKPKQEETKQEEVEWV